MTRVQMKIWIFQLHIFYRVTLSYFGNFFRNGLEKYMHDTFAVKTLGIKVNSEIHLNIGIIIKHICIIKQSNIETYNFTSRIIYERVNV